MPCPIAASAGCLGCGVVVDDARLSRIEGKLDKLGEALITLARVEENNRHTGERLEWLETQAEEALRYRSSVDSLVQSGKKIMAAAFIAALLCGGAAVKSLL